VIPWETGKQLAFPTYVNQALSLGGTTRAQPSRVILTRFYILSRVTE
jgi:hypothetical protein